MNPPLGLGDDPLEALKALRPSATPKAVQSAPDPLDELKGLKAAGPITPGHSKFTAAQLVGRANRAVATSEDEARDENVSLPVRAGRALAATSANIAQGIPGMEAAQAAVGAASSHVLGDKPFGYRESLTRLREATGKIPAPLRYAERAAGATGLLGLPGVSALSIPAQGALFGAADAALSADPESLVMRGAKTALGAGAGYLGGKTLQRAGNLLERTGVTDLIAKGLRKIGGKAADVGESIGTKGAANDLLADRQKVLDQLSGSEKSAAQTMLDHVDDYKKEAGRLYGVAREDQRVLESPQVRELLDNPLLKKAYEWAKANHQARGNEVPTRVVVNPGAETETGVGRVMERARTQGGTLKSLRTASDAELAGEYKALRDANAMEKTAPSFVEQEGSGVGATSVWTGMKRGAAHAQGRVVSRGKSIQKLEAEMARRGIDPGDAYQQAHAVGFDFGANLPTVTAGGESAIELPTPEILALAKRGLGQIANGYGSSSAVTREEAMTALPLLDKLRTALHEASPPWAQADAFYARAKTFETAFQRAFGAQQRTTTGGLPPAHGKTPEAVASWVESSPNFSTTIARRSGVQAGAAGRLADAVKNAPLGTSIGETLKGANGVFQPSETAANVRRMAFPDAESSRAFSDLIGGLQAKGAPAAPGQPVTRGLLSRVVRGSPPKNPLASQAGTKLRYSLSHDLADPAQRQSILDAVRRSKSGRSHLDRLQGSGMAAANSYFASP